jgi:hypothetical protein
MTVRTFFATLLLLAGAGAACATDWQVVLLKPRDCNACAFLEESLKRSAQLREAVLEDGAGGRVTASIVRRNSVDLSPQEWEELRALPYHDELHWRRQASAGSPQILLKRDGVIAAAGEITESADLRAARYPVELTMPDAGRDPLAVRNALSAYVGDLHLRSWNLSWFYRLALNPGARDTRGDTAWIAANSDTLSPPLGATNVLLMTTATGAVDNEIFNALRIEEIREALAHSITPQPSPPRIFYGGDSAQGANALEVRDGRIGLVRRNVPNASPFSPETLRRIFQSIRARPGSRNLVVLIGHGSTDGAGIWGSLTPLSPAMLRALHEHSGGDNVLVSGNCFGGVMARAMSCGFFGARPDIVATGCQADAAEVARSRDYLHMFFGSLAPGARRLVDADANGTISFSEAHWYASVEGDARNVTYTSVDALADAWFEAHPEALPRSIAVRDALTLATSAPAAEAQAMRSLLRGYDAGLELPLENLADQVAKRTTTTALPRVLVGQVARRLLFLQSKDVPRAELARFQSCENRSVTSFLTP